METKFKHSTNGHSEQFTPPGTKPVLPAAKRVLIACEFSGRVRDAFAAKGLDATSCDLLPSRTPGKHYQGNVLDIINDGWDLLIGFPPCTFISNVNTKWRKDIERLKQACKAMEFFAELFSAPIERICLENPVGMLSTCFRKPDQIIHPYFFNGEEKKQTCLWLKNLPPLKHSKHDTLFEKKTHGELSGLFQTHDCGQSLWYDNRKSERSILFPAIANAMADQWSDVVIGCR